MSGPGFCVRARRSLRRGPAGAPCVGAGALCRGRRRGPAVLSQDCLCQVPGVCRAPALSVRAVGARQSLCRGPRRSVCRGPALFVRSVCQGFVSRPGVGTGALCVGARRSPAVSLCRGPALCVGARRSPAVSVGVCVGEIPNYYSNSL